MLSKGGKFCGAELLDPFGVGPSKKEPRAPLGKKSGGVQDRLKLNPTLEGDFGGLIYPKFPAI